jgi:alkylhydroperoxidase/carboxymuconolactone decarboxylase family protein YurZ
MAEHPLKVFEQNDPEFFKLVTDTKTFAMTDGALSKKVKLLIAMALDAADGAESGVRSLALQAKEAGATKHEILEAIRVTHYICGAGAVFTAAPALKDIL